VNELTHVTYSYEHRHDKLDVREYDLQINTVHENYRPGRTDRVEGRRMAMPVRFDSLDYTSNFGPDVQHTINYYHKARLDGLATRQETIDELVDTFLDGDDHLEYRRAVFVSGRNSSPSDSPVNQRYRPTRIFTRSSTPSRISNGSSPIIAIGTISLHPPGITVNTPLRPTSHFSPA
jgi:hypothetical protein